MWRISYAIKTAIAHAFYWLGVFKLWQAVALRNKAVVLMYHRVLSTAERRRSASHPGYVVSQETFNRQIAYLSEHFTVLSERQFASHLDQHLPFPNSSCLITFDDGWIDNFTNAQAILRRYRLPAVIYLPVNYIGQRRLFPREALTHLLVQSVALARRGGERLPQVRDVLARYGLAQILDVGASDPMPAAIEAVAGSDRGTQPREALIAELQDALGVSAADLDTFDTFIDWDQVHQMAGNGFSFGGHGVNHRLLAELPRAEAEREVTDSMGVIAARLAPAISFSYPNGSHTLEVRQAVQAAGYKFAVTTAAGRVESGDDPYALKRVNMHEDMTDSTPMFLARVLGLF